MWSRLGLLLLFVFAASPQVRAWDETGHKVVAYIAWQRMTPEARAAVSAILRHAPPRSSLLSLQPAAGDGMVHFIRASYWPDLVRNPADSARHARYHREAWHYVDFYWEETSGGVRLRDDLEPSETNIVEQLSRLEELARAELPASAQKAIIVAWLAHLAGDIHQPLHAGSRVTQREPEGDRRGALFALEGSDHLHAYWDRALTDAFEREVGESEMQYVSRIAESLMAAQAAPSRVDLDYAAWAEYSFRTASNRAYADLTRGEAPSLAYEEMAQATAAEAVALAGHRLGALMNAIFG